MRREDIKQVQGLKVAALVSVGRHPVTGRPRRADFDARAVEMGLSLVAPENMSLLHAGECSPERESALRGYLGMGIGALDVLDQPPEADIVPALEARLREMGARLVLCGARGEMGEASGLVPFLLAERLGWSLVSGLAQIESVDGDSMTVLQALPRGQRRRLKVRLPAVVTVDAAAQAARQSAYGPARRGELRRIEGEVTPDAAARDWNTAPAKKRPKRLKIVKAASARDRFKAAAAKAEGGGGQVLTGLSPQAGAEAILKLLREEGVLR
ncbi:electron transfer flavoprotein subunit beta [Denitromonas iodatirespirans]|uniref:Electron transfer flavoprotein subunit beta n=1 Tax=Denitromonas iodatirespirans TaxID=2795389 RepID=A0A944D8H0_DENI1|nr:electron transfer flavoprotein subunit beta [Denitromonas iodatirespirans]MBT0961904.1 electron transfer flavoprotein subunit beta [Denitromonas iodatirespirans]